VKTNQRINIRIGRYTQGPPRYHLTIECGVSGVQILEAELDAEQFCNGILGHGETTLDAWLNPESKYIGARREVKRDAVQCKGREPNYYVRAGKDGGSPAWKRWAKKQVAQYEADGWIAYLEDLHNHHKYIRKGLYNVSFVRFVDKNGEPIL